MYLPHHSALFGLVLLLLTPCGGRAQPFSGQAGPVVSILSPSRIYVAGKSNVNRFDCECEQDFTAQRPDGYWQTDRQTFVLANTRLLLRTENLDCGNKVMNRDLQNALQADRYPTISLQLQELRFSQADAAAAIGPEWSTLTARTRLSMAGQTRGANIDFRIRSVGHEVIELVGAHEIRMTDFGIEPPTALLGMVKVEDRMVIHFKLWLSVRTTGEEQ